jgi:putative phosphoesterase
VPGIALISDIHGNRPALEAVLADIARRELEATYCLGDLVGYGPDPNGVIDVIRGAGIPTIAGNYDDGVGWERGDCGCYYATREAKRIGDASYEFTVTTVSAERKAFLRGLPGDRHLAMGETRIHLVHGSPRKINEYLLPDRDERTFLRLAEAEKDDVLAFGHTHQPWQRTYGGVLFVNVGSVGRPKDGDPRAMYTVLEAVSGRTAEAEPERVKSPRVEHVRVAYDVNAVARTVLEAGLPAALAAAIRTGT